MKILIYIILFIILFWNGIRFLLRFLASRNEGFANQNAKREGEVTILRDAEHSVSESKNKNKGEYVDFEEMKE